MIIRLVEIKETTKATAGHGLGNQYSLEEIFINPKHVVCLRADEGFSNKLQAGVLPEGLDTRQKFTRIYLNRGQSGIDVIVVGDPESVEAKLMEKKQSGKTLLRG